MFNFGESSAIAEAISREVSVFNFGQSSASVEAISREVSVFNYGVPPVSFSVGSTNVYRDEHNHVPFILETVLDLTNISLTLKTDDSRLQILGVAPDLSEVLSGGVGPESSNGNLIAFTLEPAMLPPTNRVLGFLNFQGITNMDSAIVPLTITSLTATRASGQLVPKKTFDGRVILIVTKPILVATGGPQFGLTAYGVPGTTNIVQSTTNLAEPVWREIGRFLETGPGAIVPLIVTNVPQQFFRDEQVWP